MDKTYLKFEQIGMSFRRGQMATEVLRDIDLSIAQGEFVSMIGHSGCGKSTLLNILGGLLTSTTGEVFLEGKVVDEPGPDRAIVFQNHSLLPWLTVYGNVAIAVDKVFGALDALTRAHLQDSVMEIHARLGNTVLMITHDVDEAVLLSDRVVMMTNGPSATIGEILRIELARPRRRLELATDLEYARCRAAVLEFLYARHRVPARAAA